MGFIKIRENGAVIEGEDQIELPESRCYHCNRRASSGYIGPNGLIYCPPCYSDKVSTCCECNAVRWNYLLSSAYNYRIYCEVCIRRQLRPCNDCGEMRKVCELTHGTCGPCTALRERGASRCGCNQEPVGFITNQACLISTPHEITSNNKLSIFSGISEIIPDVSAFGYANIDWDDPKESVNSKITKYLTKTKGIKLSKEERNSIGQLVSNIVPRKVSHRVIFTNELNKSAGYFCNEDSCWWMSYYFSRCAFKSRGGFGILTLNADGEVNGRAWAIAIDPNNEACPDLSSDRFLVFNAYGHRLATFANKLKVALGYNNVASVDAAMEFTYINRGEGCIVSREPFTQNGILVFSNKECGCRG